jgi:hypothetical protein
MYSNPSQGLIGGPSTSPAAAFTLNPGTKIAKLLPEFTGQKVNGGFVYIRTTNSVPIFGLELFFAQSGSFLANVAAASLAPGITFTPPTVTVGAGGPVLSSLSTTRTTRNTILTLNGSNFSTTASNLVEFKTTTGPIDVAASTATSTTLTVVVPTAAISGPVYVIVAGQRSAAGLVLEIFASPTALDRNEVTVSNGQTTAGIDVYVPPPAGPGLLNATQAAAAIVGASNFAFTNSANLTRGQSYDLAVSGTGMTQANGSGISFSGEGLTVSNVRYQTNGAATVIVVTIAVDANAQVGPRNIGVKNSSLDQTILAGGIFIR